MLPWRRLLNDGSINLFFFFLSLSLHLSISLCHLGSFHKTTQQIKRGERKKKQPSCYDEDVRPVGRRTPRGPHTLQVSDRKNKNSLTHAHKPSVFGSKEAERNTVNAESEAGTQLENPAQWQPSSPACIPLSFFLYLSSHPLRLRLTASADAVDRRASLKLFIHSLRKKEKPLKTTSTHPPPPLKKKKYFNRFIFPFHL